MVECRTPEREVRGSRPTAAVLCPWARHFTPRKYWLITQEAMAPSRHDWKIVDWDVKPQHNQPTNLLAISKRFCSCAGRFESKISKTGFLKSRLNTAWSCSIWAKWLSSYHRLRVSNFSTCLWMLLFTNKHVMLTFCPFLCLRGPPGHRAFRLSVSPYTRPSVD